LFALTFVCVSFGCSMQHEAGHHDGDHFGPGVRSCENVTLEMIEDLEHMMMMMHGGHMRVLHDDHGDHGMHSAEDFPEALNCSDSDFTIDFGDETETFHLGAFEIDECPSSDSQNCYKLSCSENERLLISHYIDTCCPAVTVASTPHHNCDVAATIFALENPSSPSEAGRLIASTLVIAAAAVMSILF